MPKNKLRMGKRTQRFKTEPGTKPTPIHMNLEGEKCFPTRLIQQFFMDIILKDLRTDN